MSDELVLEPMERLGQGLVRFANRLGEVFTRMRPAFERAANAIQRLAMPAYEHRVVSEAEAALGRTPTSFEVYAEEPFGPISAADPAQERPTDEEPSG